MVRQVMRRGQTEPMGKLIGWAIGIAVLVVVLFFIFKGGVASFKEGFFSILSAMNPFD